MHCLFQTMHSAPGSVVVCMPGPHGCLCTSRSLAFTGDERELQRASLAVCIQTQVLSSGNSLAPTCLPRVIHGVSLRIVQWVIAASKPEKQM